MQPEAVYWALLSSAQPALPAGLLDAWYAMGARSPRDLFEREPQALADLLEKPEHDLEPLLALRARLPQAQRLVERLAGEEIELVTARERRYPEALRAVLGTPTPPPLWLAGSLDLLARRPIAVLSSRDAPPGALEYARVLARGLALGGRPVLTGVATAIERAVLEAVLGESAGTAIAVLNQGITRALPDLRRHWREVRGGRVLLLSPAHPEAPWQPGLEDLRGVVLAGLAERIVLVHSGDDGAAGETARRALQEGRPLYVRTGEDDAVQALLEGGARPLPAQAEQAAAMVLAPERAEPELAGPARGKRAARTRVSSAVAAEEAETDRAAAGQDEPSTPDDLKVASEPHARIADGRIEEDLLRYLEFKRGKVVSKGKLLQALGVREADLDRALIALIAGGWIVQRSQRTGVGYSLVRTGEPTPPEGVFQLSLFGQEQQG